MKKVVSRHRLVIEFCKDCGRKQPLVWHVSNELWTLITERTDGGGVLCPECFDARADSKGLLLYWTAEVST